MQSENPQKFGNLWATMECTHKWSWQNATVKPPSIIFEVFSAVPNDSIKDNADKLEHRTLHQITRKSFFPL